jgi:hypothetical protein
MQTSSLNNTNGCPTFEGTLQNEQKPPDPLLHYKILTFSCTGYRVESCVIFFTSGCDKAVGLFPRFHRMSGLFCTKMKQVASCGTVGEANSISMALRAQGIEAHVIEQATSNMGIPGIPVSGTVMVSNSDAIRAQLIIQREFPNQRNAGIKLCIGCLEQYSNQETKIKKIGLLFLLWIAFQSSFFFRSFCPVCRRFF